MAPQLQDCQYAIEAGDSLFAPRMKAVLLRAFVIHKRRERWADSTLYPYRCDLSPRLEAALNLHSTPPYGIRPQRRYAALKEHRFLFLEEASIPPTNTQSERDVRMSKIFRKLTNGFHSNWGRDLFAAVRSGINTGKRHGFNAFEAIATALSSALPDFLFKPG